MFSIILVCWDDREANEKVNALYLIEKDLVQLKIHNTQDWSSSVHKLDQDAYFKVGSAKRYRIFFIDVKCFLSFLILDIYRSFWRNKWSWFWRERPSYKRLIFLINPKEFTKTQFNFRFGFTFFFIYCKFFLSFLNVEMI